MIECSKREMYLEREEKIKKFRELIIEFLKNRKGNEACFKEIINFLKEKLGEEFKEGYNIPESENSWRIVRFNVLNSSKHFSKRKKGRKGETVKIYYSPKNLEA